MNEFARWEEVILGSRRNLCKERARWENVQLYRLHIFNNTWLYKGGKNICRISSSYIERYLNLIPYPAGLAGSLVSVITIPRITKVRQSSWVLTMSVLEPWQSPSHSCATLVVINMFFYPVVSRVPRDPKPHVPGSDVPYCLLQTVPSGKHPRLLLQEQ